MATDLAPLAGTVGGGFLIGFVTGYAIKKVIKLAAVIVGLFIAALAYLEYQRILAADWHKVQAISQSDLSRSFARTLDRAGKGNREDGNQRRREITLHSFRRFVKTTISDLGYADFSEWFIGHSGSTYWTKKDSEKAEIFRKIESYLTFLNVHQLERQGADIQSNVEELEALNQSMRDRDKLKDDAIAHLSYQLIALTARLDSIESRH